MTEAEWIKFKFLFKMGVPMQWTFPKSSNWRVIYFQWEFDSDFLPYSEWKYRIHPDYEQAHSPLAQANEANPPDGSPRAGVLAIPRRTTRLA